MRKLVLWVRQLDVAAGAERAVLTAVLAIAAVVSYTHLRDVWVASGSPWPDVGPLLVDGLFAAAWLRMRRRRREGGPVGWLAWSALGLALVATVAGNLAAPWVHGRTDVLAYVVAAWPAVAFALVWELVTGHGRARADDPEQAPAGVVEETRQPDATTPASPPASVAEELAPAGDVDEVALAWESGGLDDRGLSSAWDTVPVTVVPPLAVVASAVASPPAPEETLEEKRDRLLAEGAGRPTLRRELGITDHAAKALQEQYKAAATSRTNGHQVVAR